MVSVDVKQHEIRSDVRLLHSHWPQEIGMEQEVLLIFCLFVCLIFFFKSQTISVSLTGILGTVSTNSLTGILGTMFCQFCWRESLGLCSANFVDGNPWNCVLPILLTGILGTVFYQFHWRESLGLFSANFIDGNPWDCVLPILLTGILGTVFCQFCWRESLELCSANFVDGNPWDCFPSIRCSPHSRGHQCYVPSLKDEEIYIPDSPKIPKYVNSNT